MAATLAMQIYETCEGAFALRELCTPPTPFPLGSSPENGRRLALDAYADCGLSADELVLDCEEYPCIALIQRTTILSKRSNCDRLERLARVAEGSGGEAADVVVGDSLVLDGWAADVPEVPTDPSLYTATQARFLARQQALGRRVAEVQSGATVGCEGAKNAFEKLGGDDPCNALRDFWGCSQETVVDLDAYHDYVAHAESVLDELLETCPNVTPENTLLDCRGVPCLLLVDAPEMGRNEAFCRNENLFSFTGSGWHKDLKIGVLYSSKYRADEVDVRERFNGAEKSARVQRLIDEWLAR